MIMAQCLHEHFKVEISPVLFVCNAVVTRAFAAPWRRNRLWRSQPGSKL